MKRLASYADDLLLLAGCICILVGLAQWSAVVTWIIGGMMLIGFGVMIGKIKGKHDPKRITKHE